METVSTMTTTSSYDYAEKGKSSTLTMEINNQPTTVIVKGCLYVDIAGTRVGTREITLSSALNSQIGSTEYSWGSIEVFSVTYGIFEIVVFLTPKIAWWTQVTGSLATSGPVTVSPSTITWSTDTQTSTTASFTDDQPVSITLSNPALIWADMKLLATFSGVLKIGGVPITISEKTITLVDLANIASTAPSTKLMTFESNYFKLYTELSTRYSQLLTSHQQLSDSVDTLNNKLDTLSEQVSSFQMSTQTLPWIAILIGVIAIAVSTITYVKKKAV